MIFSVNKSEHFQGFARLSSNSSQRQIDWQLPSYINPKDLSGLFEIDWISKRDLPFNAVQHLRNPFNYYKAVKIGRDGQVNKMSYFFKIKFK